MNKENGSEPTNFCLLCARCGNCEFQAQVQVMNRVMNQSVPVCLYWTPKSQKENKGGKDDN